MNIAYRLSSLEFLFYSNSNCHFFPIVVNDSNEYKYASEELKIKNIINIKIKDDVLFSELNSEEIAKFSDLGKKLNKFKISFLLIKKSNKFLEEWSQKHKIKLICSDYKIGEKIENKIYFDNFLNINKLPKPASRIILSSKQRKPFPATILQIPNSSGGEGTFLIKNKKVFIELTKKLKLPLLAREYKKGIPLGTSLFINKEKIYFTSLERQCFYAVNNNSLGNFIGIQWLPYNFFNCKTYKKIKRHLFQIGKKLSLEGLQGLINVDFILDKAGNVYFLECNPRLTFASNQIFARKELRNEINPIDFYLNQKKQKIVSTLSKSKFSGCQMLISFPPQTKFPHRVSNFISSGFFIFRNNSIQKIKLEDRMNFLKIRNGLFYYNEINKGEVYKSNIQIGTLISNFPLYSFKTGKLNKAGKVVYDYFERKVK